MSIKTPTKLKFPLPAINLFRILFFALAVSSTAFANPNTCRTAETVMGEVQREIWAANPPVGQEVYTTHAGYQRLKIAINNCQADAFRTCYNNLRPSVPLGELKALFQEWRRNRYYKLVDPSGLCYNRAYLLAQEMTERGYSVQLLHIDPAPVLISLTRDEQGRVTHVINYGKHWVVQVNATDANGISKTMVLDPQFAIEPMVRDSYFTSVSGQVCKPAPNRNVADCTYQIHGPTYQIYPSYDGAVLKNKCGWSLDIDLKNEIERAIAISPASFPASPYPYEYIRATSLKHAWNSWQDFAVNDIRIFESQLLTANDKSAIQERLNKHKVDLQNIIDRRAAIGF